MFWDVCYIFYLEKLFVINKHEMTITSQKYTFDPGLRYEVQQTKFLSFWAIFCPFTPLTIQKIKRDIIILHKCTKNHDHMLYCYWDMVCDKCNYFSFGLFFAVLPPSSLKNHNIKKIKKTLEIYNHFTQVYQKSWSYALLFLRSLLFFILGYFLLIHPPNRPKNIN